MSRPVPSRTRRVRRPPMYSSIFLLCLSLLVVAAVPSFSLAFSSRSRRFLSRSTKLGRLRPTTTTCTTTTTGSPTALRAMRRMDQSQFFGAFFDDDDDDDNDHHPNSYHRAEELRYTRDHPPTIEFLDECLKWTPMVVPILAWMGYDTTATVFAETLEALSNNNWVAVDGGDYQAKMIAPAINGVVVPAISILFANLIGTTITTLRQRQLDIRTSLNKEAAQLRQLLSLWDVFGQQDPTMSVAGRRYLVQYCSRLLAESQATVDIQALDLSLDTELNAVLAELNRMAGLHNGSGPPDMVLAQAYTACSNLYDERAHRITALGSLFPPLHFMIVATLAVSICVAFLLESNQVLLIFLNAIQLKVLWTMLVGVFSALAVVCYDLGHPFRGSYQISASVDQLYTIRLTLRASLQMDERALEKLSHNQKQRKEEEATRQAEEKDRTVKLQQEQSKEILALKQQNQELEEQLSSFQREADREIVKGARTDREESGFQNKKDSFARVNGEDCSTNGAIDDSS